MPSKPLCVADVVRNNFGSKTRKSDELAEIDLHSPSPATTMRRERGAYGDMPWDLNMWGQGPEWGIHHRRGNPNQQGYGIERNERNVDIWVPGDEEVRQQRRWIEEQVAKIGSTTLDGLGEAAATARTHASARYTGHQVGAALLTSSGSTFTGFNHEVVTLTETVHAEHHAILQWLTHTGGHESLIALAVSGPSGGDALLGPCGGCRQVLSEHAEDLLICMTEPDGRIGAVTSLSLLLPLAFQASSLRRNIT